MAGKLKCGTYKAVKLMKHSHHCFLLENGLVQTWFVGKNSVVLDYHEATTN
jgi:hypothetical protein